MFSDSRQYNYTGELTIKKSRVLKPGNLPKDDIVPWLFLKIGDRRFTFSYKIDDLLNASYNKPFRVQISFLMEEVKNIIKMNHTYEVWRAEEPIGIVEIRGPIE